MLSVHVQTNISYFKTFGYEFELGFTDVYS